jgi:hypothetical protein
MALDWKHEAIDQLDWHWRNQVRPRFEGLTDDEYFWEPVDGCWTVRPHGDGFMIDFEVPPPDPAPFTTIGWRMCHIHTLFAVRSANHFGDPLPEEWWTAIEFPGSAARALELIDAGFERWTDGIKSLDEAGSARAVGPAEGPWHDRSYAALILHINREAIHHGAEVAVLRDLYRAQ